MYHVIGTGLTALILYLLSYLLYHQSFYTVQFHRKLWNTLLAAAFILTALAGLFLALQINYKWNIPFVKTILSWHVEFGIGLAFTGIVHFLWHLPYFTALVKKKPQTAEKQQESGISHPGDPGVNLFIVGFISTSVQLLLLKEIINITGGYELIAGTFLASWLAGSAAGSAMAKESQLTDIKKINLFFYASPVVSLFLLVMLSGIFLKPGETPSFLAGIIFTLIVLFPVCLMSGFIFARLISSGQVTKKFSAGKSFSIETTGGILAGVVVSLLSSGKINTYELIVLIILFGLSYWVLTFIHAGGREKMAFRAVILTVVLLVIIFPPDTIFRQLLLRGIKVTSTVDTPYGNITRGRYGNESSTYYNHRLLAYNDDIAEREEDIHYAILQVDEPENVLLISGNAGSHIQEIAKYPVRKVVYVERDPELIRSGMRSAGENNINLAVENDDAYSYIRKTDEKFDAVISLLPPPSSLMINRYYTSEFFTTVKKKMSAHGVFECSPGINPDYFNKEGLKYYSSVYNTLKAVFKNVITVSGNKLYYIASDGDLSTSFCALVQDRHISNTYVGPDYLSDDLIAEKTREVTGLLDVKTRINSTEMPIACFYYQSFDLTKDFSEKVPAIILLVLLFALPVFTVRRENMVMYFSALSLAGTEIILLLILQTAAGNMYELTGLIIAGIMSGLAAGAAYDFPAPGGKQLTFNSLILMIIYLLLAVAAPYISDLDSRPLIMIVLLFCGFLPAFFTGRVFRLLATGSKSNSVPAVIYGSDLIGSAAGFIFFSALAVPLVGLRYSLLLLPVLILTGFLMSFSGDKR